MEQSGVWGEDKRRSKKSQRDDVAEGEKPHMERSGVGGKDKRRSKKSPEGATSPKVKN